jgi:predicted dehydrogenase
MKTNGTRSRRTRVRYAVVGLGHIAQSAVLPAFVNAGNCELTARRRPNLRQHIYRPPAPKRRHVHALAPTR